MSASRAILLVGHGTRDERGVAEFLEVTRQLEARFPAVPVAPCFLELAEPAIDAAIERLIASGSREILVAPVLLFAAGHAKRDIPEAVARAVRQAEAVAGSVSWRQTDVLEYHPRLLELAGKRLREALRDCAAQSAGESTCLVVVGRGSSDDEATAAMRRFAAIHADKSGIRHCEVAFIAMAEPKYPEVLRSVAERGYATVGVQPHLLFAGELLEKLRTDVDEFGREFPRTTWRMVSHFGPDRQVVDALEQICRDAFRPFAPSF